MRDCTHIDIKTGELVCEVCGDRVPMPLGIVRWVTGTAELFSRIHNAAGPDHPARQTYFQGQQFNGEIPANPQNSPIT